MTRLTPGDTAPDFSLREMRSGDPFTLSEQLATGQSVLLIFLRHLG
jgi:peroxiredoxin